MTINKDIPYATWDNPGYHRTTSDMYLTEKHMSIASCVAVQHDRQSRVANSSLAGHIEVVITQDLRVSSV